jgi:purine-binding chemotaxis protein CheW
MFHDAGISMTQALGIRDAIASTLQKIPSTQDLAVPRAENLTKVSSSVVEILGFKLGSEEYGLEIAAVSEVIRPMEILEVPRIPAYVRGILSLRGVIIPIFDLKRRIALPESPATAQSRIIVVSHLRNLYGLWVDSVTGVVAVSIDHMKQAPPGHRSGSEFLKGVIHYTMNGAGELQERFLILLNLERAIAP